MYINEYTVNEHCLYSKYYSVIGVILGLRGRSLISSFCQVENGALTIYIKSI